MRRLLVVSALGLTLPGGGCERSGPGPGPGPEPDFERPDQVAEDLFVIGAQCVRSGGWVACRGDNERGILGTGTVGPPRVEFVVIDLPRDAIDVAIAGRHTYACAIRAAGELWCWGLNLGGVLGERVPLWDTHDTQRSVARPGPVEGLPPVRAVTLTVATVCALGTEGTVHCWGLNVDGQVADPRVDPRVEIPRPQRVHLPAPATALVLDSSQGCALLTSREVHCWGGSVLVGARFVPAYAPVRVAEEVDRIEARVLGGHGHMCATTAEGQRCWPTWHDSVRRLFAEPHLARIRRDDGGG